MIVKIKDDKKSVVTLENGEEITSVVYTDPNFAKRIVDYFAPQFKDDDTFLDPCRGSGAFYNSFPKGHKKDWCELQEGKDFFEYNKKANWVILNPPWKGSVYAPFVKHCYELADNVVILHKLFGVLGTNRRLFDIDNAGFGIKEIILCDWKDANFTYYDGSNKAGEGFTLSVVHLRKGYKGGTYWTYEWMDK